MILDLEKELENLEWPLVINQFKNRAFSDCARDKFDNIKPLSFDEARDQLSLISEIKNSLQENISPDYSGFSDNSIAYQRVEKGSVLSLEEMFNIRGSVTAFDRLKSFFKSYREKMPLCFEKSSDYQDTGHLSDLLLKSITDRGELNSSAYPQLGKIKKEIHSIRNDIEKRISSIVNSADSAGFLQEKIYTDVSGRYVILVKSNMKSKVKGAVLDISSSGATVYIEPDSIAPLNSNLMIKKTELEREIQKILADLSNSVGQYSEELLVNQEITTEFDFLTAAAKFSNVIKANIPVLSESPVIELYSAKHPLLILYNDGKVVPNDVSLGVDYSTLIISGANTGGKTVLLKTIGLSAALAAYGFPIPASPDSKIGIFSKIIADIGDDQNLQESLSTYSGQIVRLNNMIKNADENTLLLIDEIVSGTNPRHGAALSRSILESIANKSAKTIVTTHYPELKELSTDDDRFMNGSVSFDLETLKPTYRLQTGIPGVSYTLEIAKIYNLPDEIIHRAKEFLSANDLSTEALIEKVQAYEKELHDEKEVIDKLKKNLTDETHKYKKLKKRLNEEIIRAKENQGIAFIDKLNQYKNKISSRMKDLQNLSLKESAELQSEINNMEKNISEKIVSIKEEKYVDRYIPFNKDDARIGDRVFVSSLEKMGTIVEIEERNKNALVLLGNSLKSKFKFKNLMLPPLSERRTLPAVEKNHSSGKKSAGSQPDNPSIVPMTIQTAYNTIDLRGMRVEEALNKMDIQLDRKLRDGIYSVVLIHGHGTGALKKSVRDRLKFSFYAEDYRAGAADEGGDGVTIVLLKK